MKVSDIKKGDIITYNSGRVNYVNHPYNYSLYFDDDFVNIEMRKRYKIVKIQRYKKILGIYILKTIYKRK